MCYNILVEKRKNYKIKKREVHIMLNYKFYDEITGEIFFVQAYSLEEAKNIAFDYFEMPIFQNEIYDDYDAEMLGYDTY